MQLSLQGRTIVLTRDLRQSAGLKKKIEAAGGRVILFPVLRIVPVDDTREIDEAIQRPGYYDWIIFTSANAVRFFFRRINELNVRLPALKIAAVGKSTADALQSTGIKIDLLPGEFSSTGLLKEFQKMDMSGKRCLIPASALARDDLAQGLLNMNAKVHKISVYQTIANPDAPLEFLKNEMEAGRVDCITFFSPSAVENFLSLTGSNILQRSGAGQITLAAIGQTTAGALNRHRLHAEIIASESSEERLVEELCHYFEPVTQLQENAG